MGEKSLFFQEQNVTLYIFKMQNIYIYRDAILSARHSVSKHHVIQHVIRLDTETPYCLSVHE
jgi:hypothetical protein